MKTILIGTYTRRLSEGIYALDFNTDTKKLSNLRCIANVENPTYLDYDPKHNVLYSVASQNDSGGIVLWDYSASKASIIRKELTPGAAPCYVSYDEQTGYFFDANYHQGTVHVYEEVGLKKFYKYPQGAHAHFSKIKPGTEDLYTVDLGNDTVHKYRNLTEIATYQSEPGAGPRHLVWHPSQEILYIINELNCTIDVVSDQGYKLTHLQTITTLPKDGAPSSCAAIRITADGKFIYASNRGDDSIAIFSIQDDGLLEAVAHVSTYGEHPRDFALSNDDQFLIVANRDTDTVALFERDAHSGLLTLIQKDVHVPEPVSVLFIEEEH